MRSQRDTHTHKKKSQTRLSNQAAMCQELLHTVYWPPECETSQTANDGPGDYCWIILTFGFHRKTENSRDYLLFIFFFFFFPLTLYFLIAFISVWLHWVLAASKPGAPLHSHVALGHLGSILVLLGLSCSSAGGIAPDQGSHPRPLHLQGDCHPPYPQVSPTYSSFLNRCVLSFYSIFQYRKFVLID